MRYRIAAIAMGLLLVASSCGNRADEGESDPGSDSGITSETEVESAAPGMFGTLESPCGPGDASGATEIGVTDDAIAYSSVSDSGGPVAGLNKGVDDSQAAFAKWCNDQGGINGRKIELTMRNAALFDYGPQVTAACQESFALVGGIAAFDDTGAPIQVACGLPNVPGATASSVQAGADLTYQPLPNPPNRLMVGAASWIKDNHPEVITKAAIVHSDVAALDYTAARQREGYEVLGYEFVYDEKSAIGESNWPPFVLGMQEQGVELVTSVSSWEEIVNLQAGMAQQGFEPELTQVDANFYQQQYPAAADGNAEGTLLQVTIWPFEEADQNPAMAAYLDALEAAVPGAKPEMLGVQSFSASLLWATAVKSLGSDVTREGLVEALQEIHSWDGGGLHGESDPGANKGAPCFVLLEVTGDSYTRRFPTQESDGAVYDEGNGFACSPDYIVDLPTDRDNGAKVSD